MTYHLAQLNLGVFNAPLDSTQMDEFRLALDPINAIAEATLGFVWRLQDENGESASYVEVPGADNPLLAPNLSVWRDLESLKHFVYKSGHATYLRRRAEWFERQDEPTAVMWWIPEGEIPALDEAVRRLDHLRDHGPTETGWTMAHPFDRPT